jgi:hypothetical protein
MKWVIIKGVRYPISVVSAFAAYYGDNPLTSGLERVMNCHGDQIRLNVNISVN